MFLYVAHETPHFPYQRPEDKEKVVTKENWMGSDPATYVAMLEGMDSEVGRLLDAIDEAGIREKTVVVFVSDNGGLKGTANMAPLRGAKWTTLEGGIRVPLIIRWPGRIDAETKSEQVSATFDLTCGALHLARSQGCENQVFAYGDRVLGLQFHLETTREALEDLAHGCADELVDRPFIQSADLMLSDPHRFTRLNRLLDPILEGLAARLE